MPAAGPRRPQRVGAARPVLIAVLVLVVAGAAALMIVRPAASTTGTSAGGSFTARGILDLYGSDVGDEYSDPDIVVSAGRCHGGPGYDDLAEGGEVTVTSATGEVLAAGELADGDPSPGMCEFAFSVPDVPLGKKLYQVTVTHRGSLTENAGAMLGTLAFTIGENG